MSSTHGSYDPYQKPKECGYWYKFKVWIKGLTYGKG